MAKKKKPAKKNIKTVRIKSAPPGSYDIGLDFQEQAARRGLQDLIGPQGDITWGKTYAESDRGTALADLARQRTELSQDYETGKANVETGYQRTLADLLTQQQGIERGYQILGNRQAQTARAAGVAYGGAREQAAQKRAANQAIDIAPITVARTRAGEDRQNSLDSLLREYTRGGESIDRGQGQLETDYTRNLRSLDLQGNRAQREMTALTGDLAKTRMQQYLEGGGVRTRKFNLAKPKQRKQYRRLKRQGVI